MQDVILPLQSNKALQAAMSYMHELISWRIKSPLGDFITASPKLDFSALPASNLSDYLTQLELNRADQAILLLALCPHINPSLLLNAVTDAFPEGTELPEFGGAKGKNHRGILPTGETIQFLIAGLVAQNRLELINTFSKQHTFYKKSVLYLEDVPAGEPIMSGKIVLTQEALAHITTGVIPLPSLSSGFPAERIETQLNWDDLILNETTLNHIRDLETWLSYNSILMDQWNMKGRIKPGYRVLFHGPPGTGKTLTASLLGKYTNKPVYRIDLSTVVSKYIGETEKNLASLFDKAAYKDWILFFDEADSIFGKRTSVRDAHDKYANQEVSYLLQRLEGHPGLVLLASNFKDNIDEAFTRRFQSIVEFKLPGTEERYKIWQLNLPKPLKLAPDVDLHNIARKYELSGSNIINIIQYISLLALQENTNTLTAAMLHRGIRKEFVKENRMFK